MSPVAKSLYFGSFELRTDSRELYKRGIRLKLRPQAYQVLLLLAECAGEVVSREQLRERLWPQVTYVDFEHGLNTAVKELRAVLSDSVAQPKFIQTLPRLGYRLMVPVTQEPPGGSATAETTSPVSASEINVKEPAAETDAAAESTAVQESVPGVASGLLPSRLRWWTPVVIALVLAAATFLAWHNSHRKSTSSSLPQGWHMLAVLPFENLTGDPAQEYFSDGLTEEMIDQLGRLDPAHLGVIGRNSVMRYKTNHEATTEIASELGVSYLLEGSVRRDSDKVRISAELIQVESQASIWSRQYDRELKDVLALQSEIAREIAGEIHLTLNDAGQTGATRAALQTPNSREAYDLYLRGLYFWNKRAPADIERAMGYFEQAVQKDPSSARAYAALANCYTLFSGYAGVPPKDLLQKARDAAHHAVELDDSLAEAHVSLALVSQDCDWDWKNAEAEYRRAIQLNPNYATAHHWYAEYLALMSRFDESHVEIEHARQLDPLSLIIASDHAVILYYSRQFDAAIQQFRAVLDMEPAFPRTGSLPFAYLQKGMNGQALAALNAAGEISGKGLWFWSSAAYVNGRSGKMEEAHKDLRNLIRASQERQVDPIVFVTGYLGLKENDQAITWLQKAHDVHSVSLTALKVEPIYDPLRSDPGFQELLHQMNFPQ